MGEATAPSLGGLWLASHDTTMKLENLLTFPATFTKDGEFYIVRFPEIENAITQGMSYANAIEMAQDWLINYFEICAEDGEIVPEARPVRDGEVPISVPVIVAFKVMIRNAMLERGVSQSGLAEALGMSRQGLSTLLSYRRLNSRMDTLVKVASSVGLRLTVTD